MQIGWCAPLAKAGLIEELGYDYIEVPLAAFGLEDSASVQAAAKALADCPLPTPAFGYCLPRDMPIVGPDVDTARAQLPGPRRRTSDAQWRKGGRLWQWLGAHGA